MMRGLVLVGMVLLAACDESGPPVDVENGEARTPLDEVEEILSVDKPDKENGGSEPNVPEPVKPAVPVAKPVPDKPGFVISPYNGKWIDVTGVAPGELMLDPHFPAEEKKYFRVPILKKPEPPAKPAPAEEETAPEPAPTDPARSE